MRRLSQILTARLERTEKRWLHRREMEKRQRIVKSLRRQDVDTKLVLMVMRRSPLTEWSPSRLVFEVRATPQIKSDARVWADVLPAVVDSGLHELGRLGMIRRVGGGRWQLNEGGSG